MINQISKIKQHSCKHEFSEKEIMLRMCQNWIRSKDLILIIIQLMLVS